VKASSDQRQIRTLHGRRRSWSGRRVTMSGDVVRSPSWWSALDAARLHALSITAVGEWPLLAQVWLREGLDSDDLRAFAELTPGQAAVLSQSMSDALLDLGVPVDPDHEFGPHSLSCWRSVPHSQNARNLQGMRMPAKVASSSTRSVARC
jgi:hypothetical protein